MKNFIVNRIRKFAANIVGLGDDDIKMLNKVAPKLLMRVLDNIKGDQNDPDRGPYKGLSREDKIHLLAFVVYQRQNITTGSQDRPNSEDAARVLHDDKFNSMNEKQLNEHLTEQLVKAGVNIP